jgi:hypothetical protein
VMFHLKMNVHAPFCSVMGLLGNSIVEGFKEVIFPLNLIFCKLCIWHRFLYMTEDKNF